MAKTPVELYRKGNANSPRMDNVRPNKDIAIYELNNEIWVMKTIGEPKNSGGISTFSIQGQGKNWWKIDSELIIYEFII